MMIRVLLFSLMLCLASCIEPPNQYEQLPPGLWRGVMKISDDLTLSDESALIEADKNLLDYFELPFNFEVSYDEAGQMHVILMNAEERMEADDVFYGRDPATAKDTVRISFSAFDTYLDGYYEENYIEGYWRVPYRGEQYRIPFLASYGETHRFEMAESDSTHDFSGKWKTIFNHGSENAYPAIAEFTQDGQKLSGTFMTETGDYRFLEGQASGDKLKLSVFDGAHAFLFSGKFSGDTITGEFRSGNHYKTNWIAYREDSFALQDPYGLSKQSDAPLNGLSFENLAGDTVSLLDKEYNGKIKLVNIMGTWCPNCYDEIEFLKDFHSENPEILIFSVAYEKYREKERAVRVLRNYKDKRQIGWPLLYGGYANKEATSKDFPFIDKIYSYPTLLIFDGENKLVGIQTGFYGPATSRHKEFKQEFYRILESIQSS